MEGIRIQADVPADRVSSSNLCGLLSNQVSFVQPVVKYELYVNHL